MSSDRDVTRIVRSWLEEGATQLPDRVLDSVLDQVPATHQRRAWWPTRRFPLMNNAAKIALAAAVLVAAFLGIRLFSDGSVGNLGPTSPAPTSPMPTPLPLGDGPLAAGTYVTNPFDAPNDSISFSFAVPDGWVGFGNIGLVSEKGTGAPDGMAMGFNLVGDLYSDPCHGGDADVAIGPTVDDLASALGQQSAYEATTPTDVTVGGYSGKRMDLQLPSDPEFARCTEGFYVWEEDPPAPGGVYAQGPGNRWHVWILDVDGVRVVILANDYAGTSAQDQAEWQAIVDSIRIEP